MTTPWDTETEEQAELELFNKADWERMTVDERATKAKESGLEGRLGSKLWEDLTPQERSTIINPKKRPAMLDMQVKAHIALEDSDKESWGMVKYLAPGTYKLGAKEAEEGEEGEEGELVGNWSRSPGDGFIHVFLETPLQALVDRAVQEFARYAEMRKETASIPKTTKARTPRAPKPEPEPEPNEDLTTISNVRKLLGK